MEHTGFAGRGVMFESDELNSFLKSSHTVEQEHAVFGEWNLNEPENIVMVGNYRYRPSDSESQYFNISPSFDPIDEGRFYTGATSADITLNAGFDDEDNPIYLVSKDKKMEMLYSLEDCVKPYRPRSGINKLLYLSSLSAPVGTNQYVDVLNRYISRRPRYYMSSKNDKFKYWTSYRTESSNNQNQEYGVSQTDSKQNYFISDAAPFVVYKNSVPANKIVVKMQTNVGEENLGNLRVGLEEFLDDPLYGEDNRTVPKRWRVQILKDDTWLDAISFTPDSVRNDGSPIIGADGYVELAFGLNIPEIYEGNFVFAGKYSTTDALPEVSALGYAYLISTGEDDRGTIYIYDGGQGIPEFPGYSSFTPDYSWTLVENQNINRRSKIIRSFANPDRFIVNQQITYREFDLIKGVRVVAEQMNVPNCTFDLIEMSPRLVGDFSEMVQNFSIAKTLSDLGNSSVPVGGLYASNGSLNIFDSDFVFNSNNAFDEETGMGSVIASRTESRIKFMFYEIVKNVNGYDYFIPIKSMYTEGIPASSNGSTVISLSLRDMFFYLESEKAPEMLLTDVSLSYAITVLLDNIGFSNYVFRRLNDSDDFIIPYFFVGAQQNVAQVLQDLAIASQTAMFFDEYNNFVVMSKEYLLPDNDQRNVDIKFYGHEEEFVIEPGNAKIDAEYATISVGEKHYLSAGETVVLSGFDIAVNGQFVIETNTEREFSFSVPGASNAVSSSQGKVLSRNLPNIINLASEEKKIFNNGQIDYTTRYIQRSVGKFAQAYYNSEGQNFVYKPVLLWEVAPVESLTSVNELPAQSGGYYLAASPLRSTLSSQVPYVEAGQIQNNIMDFGENVYWLTSKYNGYLSANGEIIRYDAIEYSVQGRGNVWISSNYEYQDYFSTLPFNGKMFPTGNVRIYTEPEYESVDGVVTIKNGVIKKHGRGQFGTNVVEHSAGLTDDTHWTNDINVRGIIQDAKEYLFPPAENISYPADLELGVAGKNRSSTLISLNADEYAKNSTRNGVTKNFLSDKKLTEKDTSYFKTADSGTIQTSSLIFNGPDIPDQIDESDFVSYVYKDLSNAIPNQEVSAGESGSIEENANIPYKHFGTRMRIIGKIESNTNKSQTPVGAYELFNTNQASSNNPSDVINISGGSGGIGIGLNKETNNGYFFEIVALNSNQVKDFKTNAEKVSYNIQKTPEVSVESDLMTIFTERQHDFRVNEKIIISGLIDKNRNRNAATTLNGQHTVVSISDDKKSLVAQITQPEDLGAVAIDSAISDSENITYRTVNKNFSAGQVVNISGTTNSAFNIDGAIISSTISDPIQETVVSAAKVSETGNVFAVYTTSGAHDIIAGQKVDVSNMSPEDFNVQSAEVVSVTTNTFKIAYPSLVPTNTTQAGDVYAIAEKFVVKQEGATGESEGGTATYVPLTTQADSGGKAQRDVPSEFNFANIFFYKVLAGSNVATIVSKQKDALSGFVANQATLTTLNPHPFSIGDSVQINIGDDRFDGVFNINNVSEYTITYTANDVEVVNEEDLVNVGTALGVEKRAIPQVLWRGFSEINTDSGLFAAETRFNNAESTTLYDLSVEYKDIDESRRFFLYINGKQIATFDDDSPIPIYNNVALFVRGSSRCMFENIYALGSNPNTKLSDPSNSTIVNFNSSALEKKSISGIMRSYGVSDIIKNTYYSGISSQQPPEYRMYFEEFGTIMREVAYFDIKYDRAYPALYAKLAPTANDIKAYGVSGFYSGSYGAEFLIFNNMDKTVNLDDTTGNYLRIYGVSFTQSTTRTLTVDEYLEKVGNLSDPVIENGKILRNPLVYKEVYDKIRQSRMRYGNSDFAIASPFIQTTDAAEGLLDWMIKKTIVPKKVVGISTFGTSNIQLGDIVTINYKNTEGVYVVGDPEKKYVVYNIEYSKAVDGNSTTAYLVEV